jgi:hypothetical protein
MTDTVRPETGELCAFSDKYGPHIPDLAVHIGWDGHGNRRIACVPTCPKPQTGPPDGNGETR